MYTLLFFYFLLDHIRDPNQASSNDRSPIPHRIFQKSSKTFDVSLRLRIPWKHTDRCASCNVLLFHSQLFSSFLRELRVYLIFRLQRDKDKTLFSSKRLKKKRKKRRKKERKEERDLLLTIIDRSLRSISHE